MTDSLRIAAVIGDPIAHSRSPRLHGHWLQRYGIQGHYVPLHVRSADLAQVLDTLPRMGFVGANVTIPHKRDALTLADAVTPLARRIGAANTLSFTDKGIEADNTDAYGFSQNIAAAVPGWAPRRVAVIGAGGAIRAVLVALLDLGVQEIRLTNRTSERAQDLALEFGARVVALPWSDRAAMLDNCDTLVNGTALGMVGNPPLELDLRALPVDAVVNDLVYAPRERPLLAQARARGNLCVDGLGMLLHQAAPGFQRWFGREPEVDESLRRAVMAS